MGEPIFLRPVFQERIWGGTALREQFHYDIPSERTGECWAISAHPHGESVVDSGKFQGKTLSELWEKHPYLFGNYNSARFPLLTKILDANANLSIQVHPNDEFAQKYENGEIGKAECWYILDCEDDAEIILGHRAKTKAELIEMIEQNAWEKLLLQVKVKPGDFFFLPSGTLHSLGRGILVLETQQNSDTTYRVYDYNRVDDQGKLRKLDLDKAIEVITIPHKHYKIEPAIIQTKKATMTTFIEEKYFTVYKWEVFTELEMVQNQPFMLFSVIRGDGILKINQKEYRLKKGMHFILPHQISNFTIIGGIELIVSHP